MNLDLTDLNPSDYLRVHLEGKLIFEICVKDMISQGDLKKEVLEARHYKALYQIFNVFYRRLREEKVFCGEMAEGFTDGLLCKTKPYPGGEGVPDIPPKASPRYMEGYSTGEAVASTVESLGQKTFRQSDLT